MKAISLRNISEPLYEALKEMAAKNQRSMQEQIRYLLRLEVKIASSTCLQSSRKWRKRLAGRKHTDSVAMIREDRQR